MQIFTPVEVANRASNKYLGVLVAAKFARFVNEFPRERTGEVEKKPTTQALEQLTEGGLKYRLIQRRSNEV